MTDLSQYISGGQEEFKAGHQALARIVNFKPMPGDYEAFKQGFGEVKNGLPAFDGHTHYDLWTRYNNPSQGLTLGEMTKLLLLWDSWMEKKEEEDGTLTLTSLKPFDFKKVPKRIEIRNGQTVFKEIKW